MAITPEINEQLNTPESHGPNEQMLGLMQSLAEQRPVSVEGYEYNKKRLEKSQEVMLGVYVDDVLKLKEMQDKYVTRDVVNGFFRVVMDTNYFQPQLQFFVGITESLADFQQSPDYLRGFVAELSQIKENVFIYISESEINKANKLLEQAGDDQVTLGRKKALSLVSDIIGSHKAVGTELFDQLLSGYDESKPETFIKAATEALKNLNEHLQDLFIEKEELGQIYGSAKAVRNLVIERFALKPADKPVNERLTDNNSEIMKDLLLLELIHDQGLDPSKVDLEELKSSDAIQSQLEHLRIMDENSSLEFGLEVEFQEDFKIDTSITDPQERMNNYIRSVVAQYKSTQNRRIALEKLMGLGIPVDEDGLGEIALPRSKGVYTQLKALEIMSKLDIIPQDFVVHINFSGISDPKSHIKDLLLIISSYHATDIFGSIDPAAGEGLIGFPDHSQKEVIRISEQHQSIGPLGLPILIEGDRVELRGLTTGNSTLEQLQNGLPKLLATLEEFANYTRGQESSWSHKRFQLLNMLSESAFRGVSTELINFVPVSVQAARELLQRGVDVYARTAMEAYLEALEFFVKLKYQGKSKDMELLTDSDIKPEQEMLNLALTDPGFLVYVANKYGGVPDSDKIKSEIERYYAENNQIKEGDHKYKVKTWEALRGRIAYRSVIDPDFNQEMQLLLAS